MESQNSKGHPSATRRLILFLKRRLKLNRFLLVIETKRGVSISASTVIAVDLIDLLWNLSMTFGPLNSTMTSLLLIETFLVICVSSLLLYYMRSNIKSDVTSVLLTWLIAVAIDYVLRTSMNISALIISEKASTTARVMKFTASTVMFILVGHCWQCVYTYYDDCNGNMTTVKITPSDDKGRMLLNKTPLMLMKQVGTSNTHELSAAKLESDQLGTTNSLRAPTEDTMKSRCDYKVQYELQDARLQLMPLPMLLQLPSTDDTQEDLATTSASS